MPWQWFWAPDYWMARAVVQHLLGALYLLAFLNAVNQFRPLLGEHGLTPAPRFLASAGFRRAPSVFHLYYSDRFFAVLAWYGVLAGAAATLGLVNALPLWASMAVWSTLWILYLSIVNIGQIWYAFGWESLLLEAGFLAIFLGPADTTPPAPVLWLLLWLLFRVEFGAGLIKLRGDPSWRNLTALYYHHETQPMPGPLSRAFHHLPRRLHRVEVLANHGTQLIVPFVLFAPQPAANVAAVIVIVTQAWLLLSGNFAWLNAITIVLAFAAMDNRMLGWVLPVGPPDTAPTPLWHRATVLAVTLGMIVLSYWPVRNMLGRRQVMNRSFNKLHLANTYGAFGSVTRTRYEVIIEGTVDPDPGDTADWREYEFRGKPGDPSRRPPQIAPYHLRLDWLMWFCALSPSYGRSWMTRLLKALLHNDRRILNLLRHNPFPDRPPVFVRARMFHYRFSTRAEHRATGDWWVREHVDDYVPPVSLTDTA
ncbi:lipase maturation factor [Halopolyspora algeriensis]|uniref:Lipase maturation factor n=1 Tax=Halopolyspora algeriensis TaxID=1500506 RepID=A0A368VV08_9ACTN|nr:lipase maturation factor family protein [Halopolyspora algeriensis]RCW43926.1 lipase maturation factor [Halopolyspora algeriensis]TQM53571.1 lipase maturation factor [Halopolyspora algeriensis]